MSREYEEMQVEKWVNLEDVAEHLMTSIIVLMCKILINKEYFRVADDINSKSPKLMNGCVKGKFRTEHQNEG